MQKIKIRIKVIKNTHTVKSDLEHDLRHAGQTFCLHHIFERVLQRWLHSISYI